MRNEPSPAFLNFVAGLVASVGMSYFGFLAAGSSSGPSALRLSLNGLVWLAAAGFLAALAELFASRREEYTELASASMSPAELSEIRSSIGDASRRRVQGLVAAFGLAAAVSVVLTISTYNVRPNDAPDGADPPSTTTSTP